MTPTRGWAEAWPAEFRAHVRRLLAAYRERVDKYWVDEYAHQPDAFLLARWVEVVAVATLGGIWVFARPAKDDTVPVKEVWEHEAFADWDFVRAPDEYRRRKVQEMMLGGEPDWVRIAEWEVAGRTLVLDTPQFYPPPEEEGAGLADVAASGVRLQMALEREGILLNLGIRPGDVASAERIVFVEGPTEEHALPILLTKLGWDPAQLNCAIISLGGSSTGVPFAHAVSKLAQHVRVDFTICLDGDMRGKYQHLPHMRFLPVNELEDLFLEDAAAVRDGLLADFEDPALAPKEDVARDWTVERVAQFIGDRRAQGRRIQASSILCGLAREMGTEYRKPVHGPRIAELLGEQAVELLRPTFREFFL